MKFNFVNALSLAVKSGEVCLLIAATVFLVQLTRTGRKADVLIDQASAVVMQIKNDEATMLRQINQKGGTIDVANHVLLHLDRVTGEAALATQKINAEQTAYWALLNSRSVKILDSLDSTIAGVNTTQAGLGRDAHESFQHLNAALDGLPPLLDQTKTDLASLDGILRDPTIPASLKNTADATGHVAEITQSAANIVHTVDIKVSQLAHPSLASRMFGYIMTAMRSASSLGWLFK